MHFLLLVGLLVFVYLLLDMGVNNIPHWGNLLILAAAGFVAELFVPDRFLLPLAAVAVATSIPVMILSFTNRRIR